MSQSGLKPLLNSARKAVSRVDSFRGIAGKAQDRKKSLLHKLQEYLQYLLLWNVQLCRRQTAVEVLEQDDVLQQDL